MHNISRKYPNQQIFQNSKAQKLKRIMEDIMKIMEWEQMCKECQNLGRNPREKHTTCHDKSIKMQRCVYGRKRDASLKPVEILSGYVTQPSGRLLLEQRMARLRWSGHKNRSVRTLHTWKSETWGKFAKKYFSQKLASKHACIINW
jgi:hypothetical protein